VVNEAEISTEVKALIGNAVSDLLKPGRVVRIHEIIGVLHRLCLLEEESQQYPYFEAIGLLKAKLH